MGVISPRTRFLGRVHPQDQPERPAVAWDLCPADSEAVEAVCHGTPNDGHLLVGGLEHLDYFP